MLINHYHHLDQRFTNSVISFLNEAKAIAHGYKNYSDSKEEQIEKIQLTFRTIPLSFFDFYHKLAWDSLVGSHSFFIASSPKCMIIKR